MSRRVFLAFTSSPLCLGAHTLKRGYSCTLSALSIACWIPIYCYAVYSPAIVARLKNETISVRMQLTVSIPPYICAFVAVCFAGWYADKIKSRSKVIVAGCALALFGELEDL